AEDVAEAVQARIAVGSEVGAAPVRTDPQHDELAVADDGPGARAGVQGAGLAQVLTEASVDDSGEREGPLIQPRHFLEAAPAGVARALPVRAVGEVVDRQEMPPRS